MIYFPEYLKDYFNPKKIYLDDLDGKGYIFRNGLMIVNKNDFEEEQIKTVLHETIHFHPDFMSYTGLITDGNHNDLRDDEIESKIEVMVQEIYNTKSDIVKLVRNSLNEAKKLSPNND